ncbi:MAG: hypothetical protein ACR2OD_09890, partial [Gaiellaceae bacterium]
MAERSDGGTAQDSCATVLVLDAGAPFGLELARQFGARGHRVLAADSVRFPISRFSRSTAACFRLPPPARELERFSEALAGVAEREAVDLILPAGESVFHVARCRAKLPPGCTRFIEDIEKLRTVHNKWLFSQHARTLGLSVPDTSLLESRDDALAAFDESRELVFKPVYSRFAAHTLIRPTRRRDVARLPISQERTWVAQEFAPGRAVNTYSAAQQGRITAHSTYIVQFTLGKGAGIAIESVVHPEARRWVEHYVRSTGFTGQISFDFIERADGSVTAIECNPRATSGVHLFEHDEDLGGAILDPSHPPVNAPAGRKAMGAALMRSRVPALVLSRGELRRWREVYAASNDVIHQPDDPRPGRMQYFASSVLL